jgi:hypothetical protein
MLGREKTAKKMIHHPMTELIGFIPQLLKHVKKISKPVQ